MISGVDKCMMIDPKKTVNKTRTDKSKESNPLSMILYFFALTIPKQKIIDNNST